MFHKKLIGICGIDGSGKSTLATHLAEELRARGYTAKVFKPLSDEGIHGFKKLRPLLAPNPDLATALDEFIGQHITFNFLHNSLIRLTQLLEQNDFVICDRYFVSHLANQEAITGKNSALFAAMINCLPATDCYFLLDIEPELAQCRIEARGNGTDLESQLGFLVCARRAFREYASNYSIEILDAGQPSSELLSIVLAKALRAVSNG